MTEGEIQPGVGLQINLKHDKHHQIASGMSKATIQHLTVAMSHKKTQCSSICDSQTQNTSTCYVEVLLVVFTQTAGCVQIN